jgi:hypothetical protein
MSASRNRVPAQFPSRPLSSATSGRSSTDSEDRGARFWLREWRSIQTQNPKKTAVIASTTIVAGSIASSSYLDGPNSPLCLETLLRSCGRSFLCGTFVQQRWSSLVQNRPRPAFRFGSPFDGLLLFQPFLQIGLIPEN